MRSLGVTSGLADPQAPEAAQHPVQDLPDDALLYLLASRYCEVDSELKDLAGSLFNGVQPGWPRVAAICTYVHDHLHLRPQPPRRVHGLGGRDPTGTERTVTRT
jgi:transglutaminase-like putative cysteine protease